MVVYSDFNYYNNNVQNTKTIKEIYGESIYHQYMMCEKTAIIPGDSQHWDDELLLNSEKDKNNLYYTDYFSPNITAKNIKKENNDNDNDKKKKK